MIEYTHINKIDADLQNVFVVGIWLVSLLVLFNVYTARAKFMLNISRPNIFVFEYERQSKTPFSLYQFINLLITIIGYVLFVTSLLYFYKMSINEKLSVYKLFYVLWLSLFLVFYKQVVTALYFLLLKKMQNLYKIRHIRKAFEVYFIFHLIIISFLVFFLDYRNMLIFIIVMLFISLYYIFYLLNYSNSLIKHINFTTYQLILYLCISEILPIMLVIYWLSFHIL